MMESAARERLLGAMLDELGEKGYEGIALEDVLVRCGVGLEEFEAEFDDKDGCLFAAYDLLTERLVEKATQECDPEVEWPERIRRGLAALLSEFAAQPEMARVLTRAFPSIRPSAYERYMSFQEAFVPFFAEGREFAGVAEELPGEVEMLAVGAAEAIVFEEVEAGRATRLPSMMPSILFSVLVPFLGPDQASVAMRSASGDPR
jgi:AcrR family transcriptional regulator